MQPVATRVAGVLLARPRCSSHGINIAHLTVIQLIWPRVQHKWLEDSFMSIRQRPVGHVD